MIRYGLALLGLLLPIRYTGRLYLLDQLRRNGVGEGRLPPSVIEATLDRTFAAARRVAVIKRTWWRTLVAEYLSVDAMLIGYVLNSRVRAEPWLEELAEPVRAALYRAGVDFPEPP